MRKEKGFSLIELTLVVGLVGIIGLIVMNVTSNAFKSQKKVTTKMDIHSDIVILENVLSNMINTLDMKMTFTGPGLPMTPTTYESRFLIPLVGQCRDLGTTNCSNDTGLMFINHKTKNNPAVDAVCNFNAPHSRFPNPPSLPSPNNIKIFVINGSRTTYGNNTINSSQSEISTTGGGLNKAGVINLKINDIFSVFDGRNGSLWRVAKGLQHFNSPSSPLANLLLMISMPQCYSRLNIPNDNIYYFFAAPLKPNHIPTNYVTDLPDEILKLNNVSIMTIGRKAQDKSFGINQCLWDNGIKKITCMEETKFPKLRKVDISRMDEEFRLPLNPETELKWYTLANPCSDPSLCNIGTETLLTPTAIPPGLGRQFSPARAETKDIPFLLGNSFSFYKQEFLHRIRFRLRQENKRRDIYVRFF